MIILYPIIALIGLTIVASRYGQLPTWGIFVGIGIFCLFTIMTWLEYRELVPAGSIEEDPESKRDWQSFRSFISIFGLFDSDSDDSDSESDIDSGSDSDTDSDSDSCCSPESSTADPVVSKK